LRDSAAPENLRPSIYGGWIGLLGSRLTSISAILVFASWAPEARDGILRLRRMRRRFFAFLYQDTGWLNRLEANAES